MYICIMVSNILCCPYTYRYTYNATSGAVYGTLLQWPTNYSVTVGAVKTTSSSKISLLGFGSLSWKNEGSGVTITLPYLPLNSTLQWAWTFKFENVSSK